MRDVNHILRVFIRLNSGNLFHFKVHARGVLFYVILILVSESYY